MDFGDIDLPLKAKIIKICLIFFVFLSSILFAKKYDSQYFAYSEAFNASV